MKRNASLWLGVAASLVLIGALVFGSAMTLGHWNFAALNTVEYETSTVGIGERFRNISIRTHAEDIAFAASDDGTCRVVFYEQESVTHTACVQDGTLLIETSDARKWYDYMTIFSFDSPAITVYLPQAAYDSLLIEESTGDVSVPADFAFERIDISSSTGSVELYASSSGLIRIATDTGDIHAEGLAAGELDLSTSTGEVDIRSVACESAVEVTASTGRTHMADVSCTSVASHGDTGDIALENVICTETIAVERSTGDVTFEQCDAADLLIATDTGDVTGSLRSEKVFIANSATGSVEVPETTSGGTCKITTGTGDIAIVVS